ncbi:protein-histidine N-methyltransferase [Caenorhabditis elegans]|uniref:protein-histidine N-methyltransferase n=1 Tax=Caenorhabditis elegans TaxID=6239 RepID=Q9BL48_CAEEL|nr:protein-histidine N-methyltransferase [Caenorhabditis elegans]CCD73865.1 protein-histidine N-methyltransferase [Caenorhabditis elegans]|eukprot:NP_497604.2 SET (trithorax/polycomb) domain containing [Caenorhabditis elegans]
MAPSPTAELEDQILGKIATLFEETLSKQPPSNIVELWKEHVEIRRILNDVISIQAKLGDTDERLANSKRDADSIKTFLAWADGVGIARNNVTIGSTKTAGLSLQATGPIPKSHIVARVPRHAMITLDLAKKSSLLKKAFEKDPIVGGMDNVGLALFLACQWIQNEKSKWKSYISILPTTFPTPLFYSEEQLLQLKPSPIFEEAILFYRTISRQFCYFLLAIAKNKIYEAAQRRKDARNAMETPIFYNVPFNVANFTPKLYFWAVGVVTTRVNMVPSENQVGEDGNPVIIPALIPVLDMANHENVLTDVLTEPIEDLVCYSPEEECAVITSHCDVKAGNEVTIFYGCRSKGEHLLHNGFVPIYHGKFDVLKLKIGIPKTDKTLDAKKKLIQKFVKKVYCAGNIFHVDLYNYHEQPFPLDLLMFAAIFVSTTPTEEAVSAPENRKKGLEFLKTRFSLLKRSYESSFDASKLKEIGIDGDSARLKSAELDILQLALNYCETLEKQ